MALNVLVKFVGDVTGLAKSVGDGQAKVESLGSSLKKMAPVLQDIGLKLTLGVSLPLAAMGGYAVKAASDFEKSMAYITSMASKTDAGVKTLSNDLLEMSRRVPESANALALATYSVMEAGYKGLADAEKIAEQAAKLSTATMTDQDKVIEAVTTAMKAYGFGAQDVQHVSDVFAKTLDLGVTSMEDLGIAVRYSAATMKTTGVSLEEFAAILATIAQKGVDVKMASSGLNYLMLNLLKPTKQMTAAFKTYGVDLDATSLKSKGFTGVLKELAAGLEKAGISEGEMSAVGDEMYQSFLESTTGSTDAANAIMQLFPNVATLRAAFALLGDGTKAYTTNLEEMKTATQGIGATQRNFNVVMQSGAMQMKMMWNSVQAMAISFGQMLLPVLKPVISFLTLIFTWISKLPAPVKVIIIALATIVAAIGPILLSLGGLINAFNSIKAAAPFIQAACAKIGAGFASALVPLLAITVAVAAAIAIFTLLQKKTLPEVTITTNEAAQGFIDMSETAKESFMVMSAYGTSATEEMRKNVVDNVTNMANSVVGELTRQKDQALATFTELAMTSKILTAQQKADVVANTKGIFDTQIQSVQGYLAEYTATMDKVAARGGGMTDAEVARQQELMNKITQAGVNAYAKDAADQKRIYLELAENKDKMSAAVAAKAVKDSVAQRDAVVKNAEETYIQTRILAEQAQAAGLDKATTDAIIAAAQRQKNERIAQARLAHNEVLTLAWDEAGGYRDSINWATGETKSLWNKWCDFVAGRTGADFAAVEMMSGNLAMARVADEQEADVKIAQLRDELNSKLAAAETEKGAARAATAARIKEIEAEYGALTDKDKEFMENRQQFARDTFRATADMLYKEKEETKDTTRTKIDLAKEARDLTKDCIRSEMDAERERHSTVIDGLRSEYEQKVKTIEVGLDATLKGYQDQIDAIDKLTDEEDRARQEADDQARVAELESEIANEKDAGRREELTKDLNDELDRINRRHVLEAREADKDAIRAEMDAARATAEQEKTDAETKMNEAIAREDAISKAKLDRLTAEDTALDDNLRKELERLMTEKTEAINTEQTKLETKLAELTAEEAAMQTHYDTLLAQEKAYQQSVRDEIEATRQAREAALAGEATANVEAQQKVQEETTKAEGGESWWDKIVNGIKTVGDWLPFSPAKKGPFSKQVNWGFLTDGLEDVKNELTMPSFNVSPVVGAGGAGIEKTTINVTMPGMVIREDADIDKLSRAFAKEIDSNSIKRRG